MRRRIPTAMQFGFGRRSDSDEAIRTLTLQLSFGLLTDTLALNKYGFTRRRSHYGALCWRRLRLWRRKQLGLGNRCNKRMMRKEYIWPYFQCFSER